MNVKRERKRRSAACRPAIRGHRWSEEILLHGQRSALGRPVLTCQRGQVAAQLAIIVADWCRT